MAGNHSGKREAALEAALDLISEYGFQGAPMSLIAERAQIGVGTIYRYFSNREDMINALYVETKKKISENVAAHYDISKSVKEIFQQLVLDVLDYYREHQKEISFWDQYEHSPLITQQSHKEVMGLVEPLVHFFRRAREEACLKDLPFDVLGDLLGGATKSLAISMRQKNLPIDDPMTFQAIEAIWDMLRK